MGDARSFDALKPFLDTDTCAYVFADLRGYGRSRQLRGSYTADEAAADAFYLADRLGWKRFHVVGHSMSGMIVKRMIINDWQRSYRRIKSAVAITPVTASGFPADEATKQFLWGLIHDATMTAQGIAGLTWWTAAGALVGADGAQQPRHLRCGGNARLSPHVDRRRFFGRSRGGETGHPATRDRRPSGPAGIRRGPLPQDLWRQGPERRIRIHRRGRALPLMHEHPRYLAALIESHLNAHRG